MMRNLTYTDYLASIRRKFLIPFTFNIDVAAMGTTAMCFLIIDGTDYMGPVVGQVKWG